MQDKDRLSAAISQLKQLFTFQDGKAVKEGFYKDGSYIDHTNVAYNGGYGVVLLDGFSQLTPLVKSSGFALSQFELSVLNSWLKKSFLPFIVNGEMMDLVRGRAISRSNESSQKTALAVIRSILRLIDTYPENNELIALKPRLKSELNKVTERNRYQGISSYWDFYLMDKLMSDQSVADFKDNNQLHLYNRMARLVYTNAKKDFSFALAMHSKKVLNFESMNNENQKGWYSGDGMFYLYQKGNQDYSNHYWPTVDAHSLPGTTELVQDRKKVTTVLIKEIGKEKSGMRTLSSSFVGSIKDEHQNGVATMAFKNWDGQLSAKKSWFILNDKIVFLGSDIKNKSQSEVVTTIDQKRIDPSNPYQVYINQTLVNPKEKQVYQNVTSIYLISKDKKIAVGYQFFNPTSISLAEESHSGKWTDINEKDKNKENLTQSFLSIKQYHTKEKKTYAYSMMPNVSQDQFSKELAEPSLKLLSNQKDLQAIYDSKQQIYALANHTPTQKIISNQIITKTGLYLINEKTAIINHQYLKH